ncbi:hypothetical protein NXX38_16910 [Bacteroides sp. BFG-637]|nr:hypothetical protein [Bacteroides sp. BFG-637]
MIFDFASTYLPEAWNAANKNRVTKGAAYALKSRAMLYAERWQDAYNAANEVIKLKLYDLVDDYAQAWKGNNVESILEFDYDQDTGPNHDFDQYHVPQCDGWDYGALGTPTQEMVESYETKNGQKVDWTPGMVLLTLLLLMISWSLALQQVLFIVALCGRGVKWIVVSMVQMVLI